MLSFEAIRSFHSKPFLFGACLSAALLSLTSCSRNQESSVLTDGKTADTVSTEWPLRFDADSTRISSALHDLGMHPFAENAKAFYRDNGYSYVWIRPQGFSVVVDAFLVRLDDKTAAGIGPSDSIRTELASMKSAFPMLYPSDRLSRLEVFLTCSWFEYADKALIGLPDSRRHDLQWFLPDRQIDASDLLHRYLSDTLHPYDFNPLHVQYASMSDALRRLGSMDTASWSEPFDAERPLDVLCDSMKVHRLRERLVQLGDLAPNASGNGAMQDALRRFRIRHGLGDEAALDAATIRELNVSPTTRIRQVLVNMERYKWLPDIDTGRFIVVNVPDFRLSFFEGDSVLWSCGVVVGKSETPTALFAGSISEIVFNPYWYVPASILEEELLPEFREDPSRFSRGHYEVVTRTRPPRPVPGPFDWDSIEVEKFPFDVRQTPGPWNPLGRIKFLFPNNFSMYLHDTPAKELFGNRTRAFSHGCIRVEDPEGLLSMIAQGQSRLDSDLNKRRIANWVEVKVPLSHAVPVYIVYLTAWVDGNGLNFRKDVYGHDALLHKELFPND